MTASIVLIASIAVAFAAFRFYRKRGYGRAMQWTGSIAAGMLTLLVGALVFGPQGETLPPAAAADAVQTSQAAATPSAQSPRYTAINAAAALAAKQYIGELDTEVHHSTVRLPGMDLQTFAGFSRRFNQLSHEGEAAFGAAGDPLGACGTAGIDAAALWHVRQLTHAQQTGTDTQRIAQSLEDYQQQRAQCLALFKG